MHGRYYRLPTEAEWEYACRAGTTTAYSWGNDPKQASGYAWSFENAPDQYQQVRSKKPNPWGLYDMHGNAAEWVLDQYLPAYGKLAGPALNNPLQIPKSLFPRVVRGGSFFDDVEQLRSAARDKSSLKWKQQDPLIPKSIWWHTESLNVGFRIVRPLVRPSDAELKNKWDNQQPADQRIRELQERKP